MGINYESFCKEYLGVEDENFESFLSKNKKAIDKVISKYGLPLTLRVYNSKTKSSSPIIYGKKDFEFMLKSEFGKYGGTDSNSCSMVDSYGDIVVYTFYENNLLNQESKNKIMPQSMSMIDGISFVKNKELSIDEQVKKFLGEL